MCCVGFGKVEVVVADFVGISVVEVGIVEVVVGFLGSMDLQRDGAWGSFGSGVAVS